MFTSRDCPLDPDCATTNKKENKKLNTNTQHSLLTLRKKKFVYHTFSKTGRGTCFVSPLAGKRVRSEARARTD